MFGAVDEAGDALAGHGFGGVGDEERFQELGLGAVGIEPGLVVVRAQDDGHPVVDGGNERVGLGGDDGEAVDGLAVGRTGVVEVEFAGAGGAESAFPEAGHAEEARIAHGKAEGLFAGGGGLPLIKAIGGDQASLFFKGAAVADFLGDVIGAGVGEFVADGFVLGPGGNEAPAHGAQGGGATFPEQHRGLLARGKVVAGPSQAGTGGDDELGAFAQFAGILGDGVAAAHGSKLTRKSGERKADFMG